MAPVVKNLSANAGDVRVAVLILVSGRSPGGENCPLLQYFCQENPTGKGTWGLIISVQFSSVAQSCPTFYDPMDYSTLGLPVHHQLLEFTQTHVHWVGDAIQPPHLLSSPSPPAINLPQHQGLFKWVSSSHQVWGRKESDIAEWVSEHT